jgi:hypothetical protein
MLRMLSPLTLAGSILFVVLLAFAKPAHSESAAFDLSGPKIDIKIMRAGKTLPISQTPNLQAGDRLWLHPDLPKAQSVRYLMIVAFLRGSTNPPPDEWFIRAETWKKDVREEGFYVNVPSNAQQILIFLAPETGGDFSTLRSAVRGKPGAFVRASQDLQQAGLNRLRLEAYLKAVRQTTENDPEKLKERSTLLARSLGIKLDSECFDKPTAQQGPCLMQGSDDLILDDGHSQSMVTALTSGPSSALIGDISGTRIAGGGNYSPYIGAVVDVARLMVNFRTAEYQYLPALGLARQQELSLRLNNPPSFNKPKSVLVAALPAVEAIQLPPMRPVDAKQSYCLQKPDLVLPVQGAPLVFATELAHDMALRLSDKSGYQIDLPAKADATRGGFVIDTHAALAANRPAEAGLNGVLHGVWGFDSFDGPAFRLRTAHSAKWTVPKEDQTALIVGRDATLHIESEDAACLDQFTLKDAHDKVLKTTWKADKDNPERFELQVPLKDETEGTLTLLMKEYGTGEPEKIVLHSYAEAGKLEQFTIHIGDGEGTLRGTRLDEVAGLELSGMHFVPAGLTRAGQKDELRLKASNSNSSFGTASDALHPGTVEAHVSLNDGRVLPVQSTVAQPRPKVILLSKSIDPGHPEAGFFRFGSQDELPQDGKLSFFLKTQIPDVFPRNEKIEVASTDNSFSTTLSVGDGSLVLQDSRTVLATLDPLKSFGPAGFGPLRFRPVDNDGNTGDWQPLATLVRIPVLKEIRCPDAPDKQCVLTGANLFLIDSVASDEQFTHAMPVPSGFVDSSLQVPRPNGTLLYLKLRDEPSVVNRVVLPVLPEQ